MKPILFNTEMVKAILAGRKTQTRRPVDWDVVNGFDVDIDGSVYAYIDQATGDSYKPEDICRYQVGDVLYVRETWYYESHMYDTSEGDALHRYVYRASNPDYPVNVGVGQHGWRPSIHMPKEAARIFLQVKDVRVERLQEITEQEAQAEGIMHIDFPRGYSWNKQIENLYTNPIGAFSGLWDAIYIKRGYGWLTNPWVWVIEFERMDVIA